MISRTACIKHSQAFQQAYGYQQYSLTDLGRQAMWASKQPFESNPKEAAASDRWEKPNTVLSIHPAPLIIIFKTQFQNLIENQLGILKQNNSVSKFDRKSMGHFKTKSLLLSVQFIATSTYWTKCVLRRRVPSTYTLVCY